MSEELLPCPFCGGEAKLQDFQSASGRMWLVGCSDNTCVIPCDTSLGYLTKQRAIKAWNRRAERTCTMDGPYTGTTCAVHREMPGGGAFDQEYGYLTCSACGAEVFDCPTVRYCPNCGAKVVDQ